MQPSLASHTKAATEASVLDRLLSCKADEIVLTNIVMHRAMQKAHLLRSQSSHLMQVVLGNTVPQKESSASLTKFTIAVQGQGGVAGRPSL